jgi:hypothetical protein
VIESVKEELATNEVEKESDVVIESVNESLYVGLHHDVLSSGCLFLNILVSD